MTFFECTGYTEEEEELWDHAFERIDRALFTRKLEKAMDIFKETLDRSDPVKGAIPRHFKTLRILEKMYLLRNENPVVLYMCLAVCDSDLDNAANLFRAVNKSAFEALSKNGEFAESPFYMVTPTKKAIILEQMGDLQGALEVCETALRWKVWDSGKKSFQNRIDSIKKKMKKEKAP